ncbi:MAG TPA: histidine phosphatase family protein [Micromonosporaceae bacterium]|jgi:phosphohistidine phosphatase|nr:histidine phosphatase family protein [Micromonosporaceae bacterium]
MTERTLILLRHSKSEHGGDAADIDRSLTERGHADAAAAGAWLAHRGLSPDLVICSPAKRTRQTWHGVALALGEAGPAQAAPVVRYEHQAYGGSADDLLALVCAADEAVGTVLLIGHNPSVSELSAALDPAGTGDSDGLRTSGIAVHRVSGAWAGAGAEPAPLAETHTGRG